LTTNEYRAQYAQTVQPLSFTVEISSSAAQRGMYCAQKTGGGQPGVVFGLPTIIVADYQLTGKSQNRRGLVQYAQTLHPAQRDDPCAIESVVAQQN
jgi:hypothetical protein